MPLNYGTQLRHLITALNYGTRITALKLRYSNNGTQIKALKLRHSNYDTQIMTLKLRHSNYDTKITTLKYCTQLRHSITALNWLSNLIGGIISQISSLISLMGGLII